MQIEWKDVYYEGVKLNKQVSNTGRMRKSDGTEMTVSDNGAGYMSFGILAIKKNDKWKNVRKYAHRLVAEYFIPNPDNLPQVNHKDFDKSNNSIENLEWSSRSENINHSHAGGRMQKRYEVGAVVKLTVDEVKECYTRIKKGEGVAVVARSMNKGRTTISSIVNKRSRRDITDLIDRELSVLQSL